MTTEVALYQDPARYTIDLAPAAWKLAQAVAGTEFVPKGIRGKPEAVLACILAGAEAGVSPMQALAKIHMVEGRPAMSAELMRAIVLRAGHEIWVEELNSQRCIMSGQRAGSNRTSKVTWTMDDARSAGLSGKDNWRKYPRSMLQARATAELCRLIFPDVLAGISHTVEELADGAGMEDVEVHPDDRSGSSPSPARVKAKAKKAATDTPAPAEPSPADAPPAPPLPGEPEPEPEQATEPTPAPAADEDDIVDAEIVDDGYPSGDWPPLEPDHQPEAEPPTEQRAYSPGQVIAMRFGQIGIHDRDARLAFTGEIIGREIGSSKDLTPAEVRQVLEHLEQLDRLQSETAAPATEAAPPPAEAPPSQTEVDPRPSAASSGRSSTDPDTWTGDEWRAFIAKRKLKVSVVVREAHRLGAERGKQVATLDDVPGSGIALDLIGYIEDQSLT